jgi:periplasmic protein TonB
MITWRRIVVSLLVPLITVMAGPFARSQVGAGVPSGSATAPSGASQDSSDGLRAELQDLLAAAKAQDRVQLKSLVRQMEIPRYADWFAKTHGSATDKSSTGPYRHELAERENEFISLFRRIAAEDGEFAIRQVNEAPDPEMAKWMIETLKQRPAGFSFVSWKKRNSLGQFPSEPVGYFVLLDGRYRWDSETPIPKMQPAGTGGFTLPMGITSYPSCSYCPDPVYPEEARSKHLEGTVTFAVMIGTDGRPGDIALVKTSNAVFVETAKAAVQKWRFNPAIGPSGQPIAVKFPIDVNFRLLKNKK